MTAAKHQKNQPQTCILAASQQSRGHRCHPGVRFVPIRPGPPLSGNPPPLYGISHSYSQSPPCTPHPPIEALVLLVRSCPCRDKSHVQSPPLLFVHLSPPPLSAMAEIGTALPPAEQPPWVDHRERGSVHSSSNEKAPPSHEYQQQQQDKDNEPVPGTEESSDLYDPNVYGGPDLNLTPTYTSFFQRLDRTLSLLTPAHLRRPTN